MSGCMINLNAGNDQPLEMCAGPVAHQAWIANCSLCWLMDDPECKGHPVCVTHGAELRVESLQDRNETARLVRLCTARGAG